MRIDQDLLALAQQFVLDQLAILKRAEHSVELEPDAFDLMVQTTAEPGQALRVMRGYKYEPQRRPDTI